DPPDPGGAARPPRPPWPPLRGKCAQCLGVDLVRLEPAQLLGDELGRVAAVQRYPALRTPRPAQGGVPAVRTGQRDLSLRRLEADFGDPRAVRLAALDLEPQPLRAPRP